MGNVYFIIAAVLIYLIALAHTLLGEKYIVNPIFRLTMAKEPASDLFAKKVVRFAWHLTTIVWWGVATLIVVYAVNPTANNMSLSIKIISITFLISSILSLVFCRGKHFSFYVFLAISGLLWFGL